MASFEFYQEDSPWIELKEMKWSTLTEGRASKHHPRGYVFYNQREYCDDVFIIKNGQVGMCLCTPEGGVRIATVLKSGCMFGHQTIFDTAPNSCLAVAMSDEGVDVYTIPKKLVQEKVKSDYNIVYNMLVQSNNISRMLLTQIQLMSFQRSEYRVYFYLLHMPERSSYESDGQKYLQLRFTHQDIADISGLSRVCVSNIISGLIKENILKKKNGFYLVMNLDALKAKLDNEQASKQAMACR